MSRMSCCVSDDVVNSVIFALLTSSQRSSLAPLPSSPHAACCSLHAPRDAQPPPARLPPPPLVTASPYRSLDP
jgi:hypothetical protein